MNFILTRKVLATLVFSLIFLQIIKAEEPSAKEIMRNVIENGRTSIDEKVNVHLTLIDKSNAIREKTATLFTKRKVDGKEEKLIIFHSPPDIRNSAILTIEHDNMPDDQWLYLSSYHRSRRIPPSNKSSPYMETDFTYEDLTTPNVDNYKYNILQKGTFSSVLCWRIEAVPWEENLKKESGYSKTIGWVDVKKPIFLRIEYYDKSGKLLKILEPSELEQVKGKYRWKVLKMKNVQTGHETMLQYSNRSIDGGLEGNIFSLRYLERENW